MKTARSRLDALICRQEALDHLDRAAIRRVQLEKLNALLQREKERGGFYRDLPAALAGPEELSRLPFTTEADLAENAPGLLLCSQSAVRRVLSDATSGTTGAAKRVFYTERDLKDTVALYMAGLGELIFPGDRVLITFPFSGPAGLGELIARAVTGLGAEPIKAGAALSYGEYRTLLARERPDCFVGMPVQLLSLLRACGRGSLRRALVSGDACPETVTKACEDLLGTQLFPHYGSREMAMAGAICCLAHAGMHLRENHVIAEIVDRQGRVLPPGEWGELVITTIGLEAMPLIRYRTGDRTRILPGPCPCGSETLRLDRVSRLEDKAMAVLDEALFALDFLVDWNIARSAAGYRVLALSRGEGDRAALSRLLEQQLPGRPVELCLRPAAEEDRALYRGKRRIE